MSTVRKIGIMADSHGRYAAIAAAISLLKQEGCRLLVHLGDICDSAESAGARRCVDALASAAVLAIKGNNDHSLARMGEGSYHPDIDDRIRGYLEALPVEEHRFGAVFVHSRPFYHELGLSCMVGDMARRERQRFAGVYTQRILFRGHGHSPEVIRMTPHRERRFLLSPGQQIQLHADARWFVTCGALCNGVCMTWQRDTGILTCYDLY